MKLSSPISTLLLTTLALGGGATAKSFNEQQLALKEESGHLLMLESGSEIYVVSASDVDFVYANKDENGDYSIEVSSINPLTGEQSKIVDTTVTKKALSEFVSEANKYRK